MSAAVCAKTLAIRTV